jgi:hypothetical protein
MKRTPIVLILLLAIALGAIAGPHPCHAADRPDPAASAATGHPSCHDDRPAPKPPVSGHDCCDPAKGGHILCDQACQGPAVLGVAPALATVRSFEELTAFLQDRPVPLFVLSIDHVPLA